MKEKLTSRKLWMALIGAATGIVLMLTGDATQGAATLIVSVLSYIVAEGYIDAKAVDTVLEIVDDATEQLASDAESEDQE